MALNLPKGPRVLPRRFGSRALMQASGGLPISCAHESGAGAPHYKALRATETIQCSPLPSFTRAPKLPLP
jgi:hypothetical protein